MLNVWVVRMDESGHVERPFHVFLPSKVLHEHRYVQQHVQGVFQVRAKSVKGVRSGFHATVFDVLHGADHFLVDFCGGPSVALWPWPNAMFIGRR